MREGGFDPTGLRSATGCKLAAALGFSGILHIRMLQTMSLEMVSDAFKRQMMSASFSTCLTLIVF